MRRPALFALAAWALAACSPAPGGSAGAEAPRTPATAMSPGDAAHRPGARYEFPFSAKDPATEDPRIVAWLDDPCGATPVAVVEVMPLDDPALQPDVVVEFDAGGRELQRWGKPFSAGILGLSGNRLLFDDDFGASGGAWWTDAAGAIGPVASPPAGLGDDLEAVACPALAGFDEAAALQCFEITDQAGLRRRLAWEGACS